jgi:hypothetical protein
MDSPASAITVSQPAGHVYVMCMLGRCAHRKVWNMPRVNKHVDSSPSVGTQVRHSSSMQSNQINDFTDTPLNVVSLELPTNVLTTPEKEKWVSCVHSKNLSSRNVLVHDAQG